MDIASFFFVKWPPMEVPPGKQPTLLKMLRDSGTPQKVMATGGQFQQPLPQGRTYQLLRLRIDPALDLIPEISGNRLLVSVRLMRMADDNRLHLCAEEAPFELTLCA